MLVAQSLMDGALMDRALMDRALMDQALMDRALIEMPAACQQSDSWACAAVYHWTGNEDLARAAAWAIGRPLSILTLVLIGLLARWLVHRGIDRLVGRLVDRTRDADAQTGGQRRVQRARTMGSLLKSITSGVVVAVVLTMAVAELGFNIGPLIASAGIIGVALGFGAQSLVRDFLSGVFMIFEDQYGVGDSVDLGEASGTVEAVGLRVTRLRDVDGTVWYVRNGEVVRVGNQSQNWARSVLDIAVAYKEDITRVRRVLREVAQDLYQDPAFATKIIEEPEVWGVQSLGPDAVVVRVTLKTMPMEQWVVAREMRERVKKRFDAEGIQIPAVPRGMPQASPASGPTDGPAPDPASE